MAFLTPIKKKLARRDPIYRTLVEDILNVFNAGEEERAKFEALLDTDISGKPKPLRDKKET